MFRLILIIIAIYLCGHSLMELQRFSEKTSKESSEAEVLYLPNGTALSALSLGYKNFLADSLWFKTISYFGKHYRTDRDYQWLYHMCNLVTDLDPQAKHVYRFGSTMLAWEASRLEDSLKLLDKAVSVFPNDWLFYYLRGFTYMYFVKDMAKAKDDFVKASELPDRHPIVISLAAKSLSELNDPRVAVMFLRQMIEESEDSAAREALIKQLNKLLADKQ